MPRRARLIALAARSESFGQSVPLLPDITTTNRELTGGAAFADFNLAFTRLADHLVVVGTFQVLFGGGQSDTVVADLRTVLPSVDLGLESTLALGVVVGVVVRCAQGASVSCAPLEEVLARSVRVFNATISRLGVANASLIVAKEVDSARTREGRAGVVTTSTTESTLCVAHNERVTRTVVHRFTETNDVTQINAVARASDLTGERGNRIAFTIKARVVRVLLGADVQVVHVVVARIVDGTVHVSVRPTFVA